MTEPISKWQPVTDFYKEQQAAQPVDPEADRLEKLREIQEQAKKSTWEKKAPFGVRVVTWYLFCRAGLFLLLLTVLAILPQSSVSTWLVNSVERSLPYHAERAQRAQEQARQRQMLEQYGINPDTMQSDDPSTLRESEQAREDKFQQQKREFVTVALLLLTVLTSVVAFMWWNRSWKIRWVTMFYAGGFVAKSAVYLFAGWASGVGSRMSPVELSSYLISLAVNSAIFCYLAFSYGVEEWFKEW